MEHNKLVPEFQKGDIVTYCPYDIVHKAKVQTVRVKGVFFDNIVEYVLTGCEGSTGKMSTVNAVTTGRCIQESVFYIDHDQG